MSNMINFNRLYNRHRVTLAQERVIHNMQRLYNQARNDSERRQRANKMREYYNELEREHSFMRNFLSRYAMLENKSRVSWIKDASRVATVFSWTTKGWNEALDVISGDFVSASEGFYDPLLHGDIKCILIIKSAIGGAVKITTSFSHLLSTVNNLKDNYRSMANQNATVSGYINPDDGEFYTIILKFITNKYNFNAFLDTLHVFGLNNQ